MIKSWEAHSCRKYTNTFKICGETLLDAISTDLHDLLYYSNTSPNSHDQIKLQSVYYSPSILGGKGGVVAEIACRDMVEDKTVLINAWIYASEKDLGA